MREPARAKKIKRALYKVRSLKRERLREFRRRNEKYIGMPSEKGQKIKREILCTELIGIR